MLQATYWKVPKQCKKKKKQFLAQLRSKQTNKDAKFGELPLKKHSNIFIDSEYKKFISKKYRHCTYN